MHSKASTERGIGHNLGFPELQGLGELKTSFSNAVTNGKRSKEDMIDNSMYIA